MRARQPGVRQRVIEAAATMLAQHGLNAASIREMTKRADAPFGSTYYHFPGGKQQVVVEAVHLAGERVSSTLEQHLQSGAVVGLPGFFADWRSTLLGSDFRIGCPVMAAAVEEPIDDIAVGALDAAAQVFSAWQAQLVASLQAHGCASERAQRLATLIIASVEGAIVLCRAKRSIEPFDHVAAELIGIVDRAENSGS